MTDRLVGDLEAGCDGRAVAPLRGKGTGRAWLLLVLARGFGDGIDLTSSTVPYLNMTTKHATHAQNKGKEEEEKEQAPTDLNHWDGDAIDFSSLLLI